MTVDNYEFTYSMIENNDIILEGNIAVHIVRWITVGAPARAIKTATSIQLAVKTTKIGNY